MALAVQEAPPGADGRLGFAQLRRIDSEADSGNFLPLKSGYPSGSH